MATQQWTPLAEIYGKAAQTANALNELRTQQMKQQDVELMHSIWSDPNSDLSTKFAKTEGLYSLDAGQRAQLATAHLNLQAQQAIMKNKQRFLADAPKLAQQARDAGNHVLATAYDAASYADDPTAFMKDYLAYQGQLDRGLSAAGIKTKEEQAKLDRQKASVIPMIDSLFPVTPATSGVELTPQQKEHNTKNAFYKNAAEINPEKTMQDLNALSAAEGRMEGGVDIKEITTPDNTIGYGKFSKKGEFLGEVTDANGKPVRKSFLGGARNPWTDVMLSLQQDKEQNPNAWTPAKQHELDTATQLHNARITSMVSTSKQDIAGNKTEITQPYVQSPVQSGGLVPAGTAIQTGDVKRPDLTAEGLTKAQDEAAANARVGSLVRQDSMIAKAHPEYLTYMKQGVAALDQFLEKAGGKANRKDFQDYMDFRGRAERIKLGIRKDMLGAGAAEEIINEFDKLFPNPDMSVDAFVAHAEAFANIADANQEIANRQAKTKQWVDAGTRREIFFNHFLKTPFFPTDPSTGKPFTYADVQAKAKQTGLSEDDIIVRLMKSRNTRK